MPCSTIARDSTVVASRWANVFAGAGSVRSSAGHVDRLHRRDRALVRRRDPLLQLPHLGGERRLVADGARHPAQERRDLGAGLDEAEDVVDEEQHVLALVAEVLGHRQAGQADAQTRSRRLVHLPVAESHLVEHARLLHLDQEVVALAGALADAREHRHAAVLRARCCGSAPGSERSCRRRRRRTGRSCRRGRTGRSGRSP